VELLLLPTTKETQISNHFNHRLRGSASTVLTATAYFRDQKMAKFDPHRIKTPKPIAKKLSWAIKSARRPAVPNLVQIGSWGLLGRYANF